MEDRLEGKRAVIHHEVETERLLNTVPLVSDDIGNVIDGHWTVVAKFSGELYNKIDGVSKGLQLGKNAALTVDFPELIEP